jgi:FkbH-like protein
VAWRQAKEFSLALADLLEAARRISDFAELSKLARLLDRLAGQGVTSRGRTLKVAILASSTTDFLLPIFRLFAARDKFTLEIYQPPYGTYLQEIANPQSELYSFRPNVVIVAQHWRDAHLKFLSDDTDAASKLVADQQKLSAQLLSRLNATLLVHGFDFPADDSLGNLSSVLPGGRRRILTEVNWQLAGSLPPGALFVDTARLQAEVGAQAWNDEAQWHVAKQHPGSSALPKLIEEYLALIKARFGLSKKVLVLDLDNTLWGGIVGEDGAHALKIGSPSPTGEAHAALQRYALELKQRGVLLAVCSKNNEPDARQPFLEHSGMVLKLEDFVAFNANWDEKPENLRRIAQQLNVGVDSLVFLDDNPIERAKVRRELPEVAVVELPIDPAGYVAALHQGRYFEALSLSADDFNRSALYQVNVRREKAKFSGDDLESFLDKLDMRMEHGPFNDKVAERVVQLFNKTNQFNVTTRRHGLSDVKGFIADTGVWTQWYRLIDCYGDNGLIGLLVAGPAAGESSTWEIDSFLMSCRVLGRKAEEFMLVDLLTAAKRQNIERVRARYIPTQKNGMVADIYAQFGFQSETLTDNGEATFIWDLNVQQVPAVRFVRGEFVS